MNIFKKIILFKSKGATLLELMLSMAIGSVLILMLYRSFDSMNTSVIFLKNISEIHTQRTIASFHLLEDIVSLSIPLDINKFYGDIQKLKDLNSKKEDQNANKKEEDKNKEKEIIEKYIKEFCTFLPKLNGKNGEKNNKDLNVSWTITRGIMGNELSRNCKIEYKFFPLKISYKKDKMFALKRTQSYFKKDENDIKEHKILFFVNEPEIAFLMPVVDHILKEDETKDDQNEKENKEKSKKNNFAEWKKNPKFEVIYDLNLENDFDFLKKPIIPYKIIIMGNATSINGKRSIPLNFEYSVPCAEFALESFFNFKEKLQKNKQKKENYKKQDSPSEKEKNEGAKNENK